MCIFNDMIIELVEFCYIKNVEFILKGKNYGEFNEILI